MTHASSGANLSPDQPLKANQADIDLTNGLKMTELGPLPEEWRVVKLGEVAYLGSHRKKKLQVRNALIPFVPMSLLPEDDVYVSKWEMRRLEEIRSGIAVQEGDFLLAKITPCLENGKQGIVKGIPGGWGFATTEVIPIRSYPQLHTEYLALYLKQPSIRQELASKMEGTTGRQRLPKVVVEHLLLPLPPLPEQRAIAHVLRTVQEAKEATARVIAAARELKKSLMRHLFTYGPVPVDQTDQVTLQDTEIGPIPAHWRVVKLGEVANVCGGKRLPKGHEFSAHPTSYPYIRVTDFSDGTVDKTNLKYLTSEDHEILKRYTISSNDIYISIAGTIGLVGVIPPELDGAHLTENAAKIVIQSKGVHRDFLVSALGSEICQVQIHMRATKTSQPKLALARIKTLDIPLPPIPEQQEIARLLRAVDEKIRAEEKRKETLETLFKTLLHHLMTAKVRVPPMLVEQFREEKSHE